MFWVLMPHVSSYDTTTVYIVAGMTSFCMTGVFDLGQYVPRHLGRLPKKKQKPLDRISFLLSKGREIL